MQAHRGDDALELPIAFPPAAHYASVPLTCRLARVLAFGLLTGCGTDPPSAVPCPKPGPAFEVLIRPSTRSELPSDLEVRLLYGGSLEETYELAAPKTLEALFCRALDWEGEPLAGAALGGGGAAGAGGSGNLPEALGCDLWVETPATLEVRAALYTPIAEELELELDRCGRPQTVKVRMELEMVDGGVEDAGVSR